MITMNIDNTERTRTVGDACPRCTATDATVTLLTSMTRYFVCNRCQSRWQVSRVSGGDKTGV
jgi:transposase-like protein